MRAIYAQVYYINPMSNAKVRSRIRSFGRIATHMSLEDKAKLDKRLEPFMLSFPETPTAGDIPLPKQGKVIVELGIGSGDLLAARALKEPENHFIGCEVFKNGLKTLVINIEKNAQKNIQMSDRDGRQLLEALPKNSVDELVILYPDPWPKKRHNKRRIINAELLTLADQTLKEEGILFIATDIPDYANWIIHQCYQHSTFFPTAISPAEWSVAPSWWVSTKYEKKAFQAGRKPWYLTFKRGVDKSNTKCQTLPK